MNAPTEASVENHVEVEFYEGREHYSRAVHLPLLKDLDLTHKYYNVWLMVIEIALIYNYILYYILLERSKQGTCDRFKLEYRISMIDRLKAPVGDCRFYGPDKNNRI